MKWIFKFKLMACVVVIAAFASCSDKVDTDNTKVVPDGKPTLAKITLTHRELAPRLLPNLTAKPTAEESKINKATLYIFNSTKNLIRQVDFDIEDATDDNGDPIKKATKVVELTTGTRYFYALVNYPADTAPEFPDNISLDAVTTHTENIVRLESIKPITTPVEQEGGHGFMMSSIGDAVSWNVVEATQQQATDEELNHIFLPVGRTMAKVNVLFEVSDPAVDQPLTGTLGNVYYQGAHNPKTMFGLPNVFDGQVYVPHEPVPSWAPKQPKARMAAEDMVFFPDLTSDLSEYYVTADGDESKAIYMVENSNSEPKVGNSSFILLKGTFATKQEYRYSIITGDPMAEEIPVGTTFRCAVDATGLTYKKRFYYGEPVDNTALDKLTAEYNADRQPADQKTFTGWDLYTNAECYYAWFMKDEEATTRMGKYTVARNTYYGIHITSVSDLGSSSPDKLLDDHDRETPLGVDSWIKAEVQVLDWSLVYQIGGI